MICFEVAINGEPVYRAGIGESGMLRADVHWANLKADPQNHKIRPEDDDGGNWINSMKCHASGYRVESSGAHYNAVWEEDELSIGDVVTIRIVEADDPDPPHREYVQTPEEHRERLKLLATGMMTEADDED